MRSGLLCLSVLFGGGFLLLPGCGGVARLPLALEDTVEWQAFMAADKAAVRVGRMRAPDGAVAPSGWVSVSAQRLARVRGLERLVSSNLISVAELEAIRCYCEVDFRGQRSITAYGAQQSETILRTIVLHLEALVAEGNERSWIGFRLSRIAKGHLDELTKILRCVEATHAAGKPDAPTQMWGLPPDRLLPKEKVEEVKLLVVRAKQVFRGVQGDSADRTDSGDGH